MVLSETRRLYEAAFTTRSDRFQTRYKEPQLLWLSAETVSPGSL